VCAGNSLTGPINFYRHTFSLGSLMKKGEQASKSYSNVTTPTLVVWGDADAFLEKPLAQMSAEVILFNICPAFLCVCLIFCCVCVCFFFYYHLHFILN
jgi:hypothetical protein